MAEERLILTKDYGYTKAQVSRRHAPCWSGTLVELVALHPDALEVTNTGTCKMKGWSGALSRKARTNVSSECDLVDHIGVDVAA